MKLTLALLAFALGLGSQTLLLHGVWRVGALIFLASFALCYASIREGTRERWVRILAGADILFLVLTLL